MAVDFEVGQQPGYNTRVTLLASAARTTAQTITIQNKCCSGMHLIMKTTAGSGYSLVITISGTTAAGLLYTILASAAIAGSAQTVYKIFPGATAAANAAANDFLPETITIGIGVADATSATYSLEANFLR